MPVFLFITDAMNVENVQFMAVTTDLYVNVIISQHLSSHRHVVMTLGSFPQPRQSSTSFVAETPFPKVGLVRIISIENIIAYLLDSAFYDIACHKDGVSLAYPQCSCNSLRFYARIPLRFNYEDTVCRCKVEPRNMGYISSGR